MSEQAETEGTDRPTWRLPALVIVIVVVLLILNRLGYCAWC